MKPTVAYLAQGRLCFKTGDDPPRRVESRFGEAVRERFLQIDQRHSWKTQGRGAQFMSRGLLWPGAGAERAPLGVAITSLGRGRQPGELLYALETPEIAGVFAVREEGGEEQRLFHGNERRVRHISGRPGCDGIACSIPHASGTACIAVMDADGSNLAEVTEGDSVDQAPSWIPGPDKGLLFQSAGVGRDREGRFLALGPFAVKRLDLERGEIVTLAEDPRHDLLGPRIGPGGELLYIRRPYAAIPRASFWGVTKDFLFFPLRLLHALFQWLNFFTVRYSGKPLTTAGGPKKQGADIRQMMVWGNLIDAEQAARESRERGDDTPDLVPGSWQLVRQRGEKGEVVAKGVLAFDLAPDGSVVYTNGSAIYHLTSTGERERLVLESGIDQVVVL